MVTPPLISTSIFVTVIHMLVMMCIGCPDLAVVLLKLSKFHFCYLLGSIFFLTSFKSFKAISFYVIVTPCSCFMVQCLKRQ